MINGKPNLNIIFSVDLRSNRDKKKLFKMYSSKAVGVKTINFRQFQANFQNNLPR